MGDARAEGRTPVGGLLDSSVFESKKRESDDVLKRFLLDGLKNTSVTCVLVGAQTTLRRWVRYEILRSFMRGNGLLAVRIHSVADLKKQACARGSDPFRSLAFTVDGDRVRFKEYMTSGWKAARDVGSMPLGEVAYDLGGRKNHRFSTLFPIYDWDDDDGYQNLAYWIEEAADDAGR